MHFMANTTFYNTILENNTIEFFVVKATIVTNMAFMTIFEEHLQNNDVNLRRNIHDFS